jgi:hypothetical protein
VLVLRCLHILVLNAQHPARSYQCRLNHKEILREELLLFHMQPTLDWLQDSEITELIVDQHHFAQPTLCLFTGNDFSLISYVVPNFSADINGFRWTNMEFSRSHVQMYTISDTANTAAKRQYHVSTRASRMPIAGWGCVVKAIQSLTRNVKTLSKLSRSR